MSPARCSERLSRCTITKQTTAVLFSQSTGISRSSNYPTIVKETGSRQKAQLGISDLDGAVERFLDSSVAPSTRSAYKSAQRRFAGFCVTYGIQHPFPLQEDTLCRYVVFLAEQKLKHRTIKSYLSGIRHQQIQKSLGNPFANGGMPRLECVLTGIKREEARANPPKLVRLPITLDIMQHLRRVWIGDKPHPEGSMLWAAACVGFFGFLRAGEFTVPSVGNYDPEVHLNLTDLAVDSHSQPSMVRIRIKQSKTDPFRQGVDVFLGSTEGVICPVRAIIEYIGNCNPHPGPLFIRKEGTPLTCGYLVASVQQALSQTGLNVSQYNGHSFRIGAATMAAQNGLEDLMIQTLGRWRSDAYKLYIKISQAQLANVSRTLARPSSQISRDC